MVNKEDLSEEDQLELEKFSHLCRLVSQAELAGVPKELLECAENKLQQLEESADEINKGVGKQLEFDI